MTEKKVTTAAEAEALLRNNLNPEDLKELVAEVDEKTLRLLVGAAKSLSWERTMDTVSRMALASFAIDHKK